jgi:hypothetical protein
MGRLFTVREEVCVTVLIESDLVRQLRFVFRADSL